MAGDRHTDRQDVPSPSEQTLIHPRRHHVRESVSQSVARIRARAESGARDAASGGAIDARMDRIVSEHANHTRDAPGRTRDGDGRTNDTLRATLEAHRREMEVAGVSADTARARNATRSKSKANPTADRHLRLENLPSQQAALRKPRFPGRPSITTVTQQHSNGPRNFARTDAVDRPKSMPALAPGGGAHTPVGPMPPRPALGAAEAQDRNRTGPSRSI